MEVDPPTVQMVRHFIIFLQVIFNKGVDFRSLLTSFFKLKVYAEKEELPQYVEALDSVDREYYPSQQVKYYPSQQVKSKYYTSQQKKFQHHQFSSLMFRQGSEK